MRRGNTEVYGENRRKESGERTTHSTRIWRWLLDTNVNHISGKASAFYFLSTNLIIRTVKIFQSKIIKDNPKNKSGSVFFVKKMSRFFSCRDQRLWFFLIRAYFVPCVKEIDKGNCRHTPYPPHSKLLKIPRLSLLSTDILW